MRRFHILCNRIAGAGPPARGSFCPNCGTLSVGTTFSVWFPLRPSPSFPSAAVLRFAIIVGMAALAGCARYAQAPLTKTADLVGSASALEGAPRKSISLRTLDRLVLDNNPDLVAARARLGLAQAQILVAGILPNPVVTGAYPFLVAGPGTVDSYSAGFSQDLKSLLLLRTRGEVARAAGADVDATLLWQEWQTIGKARLLYVDIASGARLKTFVRESRKLLRERFDLTKAAIAQGNATLATLSPDLVAVGDVERVLDGLDRLQLNRRHQLAGLLGLAPDAPLALSTVTTVPTLDAASIEATLVTLSDRRPDLVALQYGYRSQDAKVRQAILSQFPNLAFGLFAGQDTSGILAIGPQVSMDLPVFDRNQGGIAQERSARDLLRLEFKARLKGAVGQIEALLSEQAVLRRQVVQLEPRLKEARTIAERTEDAFKQGTFDERAYVDIESARLAREQEKVALEQAVLEGEVALATLVGAGFPSVTIPPEPSPADPFGLLRMVGR